MTKRISLQLALPAAILAVIPFGFVALARAQQLPAPATTQVELDRVDVRTALRKLFKDIHVSYSISPAVQGVVTVSLRNVPFDMAIQSILRQVDATYRVEAGVYEIITKQEAAQGIFPAGSPGENPAAPVTVIQDSNYLYIVVGGSLAKVQKSDLKVVKSIPMVQSYNE